MAACVLIGAGLGMLAYAGATREPIATAAAAAPTAVVFATPTARPSRAGEETRIRLRSAREYPIASERSIHATLMQAWVSGDQREIARLVAAGHVFLVDSQTRVRIWSQDRDLVRVVILDGPQAERSGWLPADYLAP